jgi:hypothetical protein
MFRFHRVAPKRIRPFTLVAACFTAFFSVGIARGADVTRVEEHWQLEVGGPDEALSAPQVSMVMSPTGDLETTFFIFSLNHWSYPDYAPGGLELQRWSGDEWVSSHHGPVNSPLHHDSESVSWIQRLSLNEGQLVCEIREGTSETWGAFGGQGYLKSSSATQLIRLNDYKPAISLEQSGISYAGNRVSSLLLKKLVWWTDDGEQHELVAPIDIHTDLDP